MGFFNGEVSSNSGRATSFVEIVSRYRQLSVTGKNVNILSIRNLSLEACRGKCDRITDWQSDKSDLTTQLHVTTSTCCILKLPDVSVSSLNVCLLC